MAPGISKEILAIDNFISDLLLSPGGFSGKHKSKKPKGPVKLLG